MVVVTRRLRTAVAPSERTEYDDFLEDKILKSSYGAVGRPLADAEDESKIYQESHPDPAVTFFKPFSVPYSVHTPDATSHIRSDTTISALTWIIALTGALFLGILIYQIYEIIPYYSSTITPIPPVGIFSQDSYRPAATYANLPSLPATVSSTKLSLNPILPFPAK